jgi:beta-lactamase superfamily II metal-dependent hydrolase
MRMRAIFLLLVASAIAAPSAQRAPAQSRNALNIYFIDVEGGQATLLVSPSGESMLVDTGFPGFDGRDADRIAATAKQAGVSRIDYLVVTHYHTDHVGGVPALATRLPIRTFVDHGPSVEHGDQPDKLYNAYLNVRKDGRHLQVKPGDTIPIAGIDVRVVSSAGDVLRAPLSGGGAPNPACRDFRPMDEDATENARSVGTVIQYGRFRMLDLGDLTWNKEHDLVCPNNVLGTVDVYLTTHHGMSISGSPVIVHAVHPRVAVMNNGAKKGGAPQAWSTVHDSPGLEDFWQLHYSVDGGPDHNAPERFIANVDETTAHAITIAVKRDGSFVVTNTRNGFSRSYPSRR